MYYTDKPNVFPQEKLKIPYNILSTQKRIICTLYKAYTPIFIQSNCQTINKFSGINNVFTLKFYNWNWLLDVVGGSLLLKRFEALNLEFQVSRSFYFFTGGKLMYISIYWCCYVLICHSRNTKSNIDDYRKMQKALITTDNGKKLVLQH